MKQVYKYDEAGRYIEPVLIMPGAKTPPNTTDIAPPVPNWKPVFNGGKWIEMGEGPEEGITPNAPSLDEKVAELEAKIAELSAALETLQTKGA